MGFPAGEIDDTGTVLSVSQWFCCRYATVLIYECHYCIVVFEIFNIIISEVLSSTGVMPEILGSASSIRPEYGIWYPAVTRLRSYTEYQIPE